MLDPLIGLTFPGRLNKIDVFVLHRLVLLLAVLLKQFDALLP